MLPAPTNVDKPGQKLGELVPKGKTVPLMLEIGIDLPNNERMQLAPEMVPDYDKIIVMAEPKNTPDWLAGNPKAEIWDIDDPMGKPMAKRRIIRDEIKARVADLDRRLHPNV